MYKVTYKFKCNGGPIQQLEYVSYVSKDDACAKAKLQANTIHGCNPHTFVSCNLTTSYAAESAMAGAIVTSLSSLDGCTHCGCHVAIRACYCDGTLIISHGFGNSIAEACAKARHLTLATQRAHGWLRWSCTETCHCL